MSLLDNNRTYTSLPNNKARNASYALIFVRFVRPLFRTSVSFVSQRGRANEPTHVSWSRKSGPSIPVKRQKSRPTKLTSCVYKGRLRPILNSPTSLIYIQSILFIYIIHFLGIRKSLRDHDK